MSLVSQISAFVAQVAFEFNDVRTELAAAVASVQARDITGPTIVSLTDGATISPNASLGSVFKVDLAGDRTINGPSSPTDGQRILLRLKATTTARTVTLQTGTSGSFAFGTDVTSVPQIASGKTTYVGAIYNADASRWHVLAVAAGY